MREENPQVTTRKVHTTLSEKTRVGTTTIKKIILEYERTGNVTTPENKKPKVTSNKRISEFDRNAIRRKVHQFYMNKELPTLEKILKAVNEDEDLPNFKRTNFWKLLKELDFTFVRRGHHSAVIARDDIILWRQTYLKAIKKFREEGRRIYYLDETWVNAGDVSSKIWIDTTVKSKKDAFLRGLSTGPCNPTGKGKRLIVLHIGSAAGFVPDGLLCFESKKNSADYHDEMNGDTFLEWFENILPKLEDNAVIVMDNAPYHSVKFEKLPTKSWNKAKLIEWLQSKGVDAVMTMLKAELLQSAALIKDKFDKYVIDEKAKEHNKTVLRLPPYHCELNPIEMIWSMVKGHVKKHNTTFKINDVQKLLVQGVERVTAQNWTNFERHVMTEERRIWEVDNISDRMTDEMAPVIIQVGNETDTTTDSSDGEDSAESE